MNDVPDLPEGYGAFVEQLKRLVRTARLRATRVVNTELLLLTGISAAPSSISRLPRGERRSSIGWPPICVQSFRRCVVSPAATCTTCDESPMRGRVLHLSNGLLDNFSGDM